MAANIVQTRVPARASAPSRAGGSVSGPRVSVSPTVGVTSSLKGPSISAGRVSDPRIAQALSAGRAAAGRAPIATMAALPSAGSGIVRPGVPGPQSTTGSQSIVGTGGNISGTRPGAQIVLPGTVIGASTAGSSGLNMGSGITATSPASVPTLFPGGSSTPTSSSGASGGILGSIFGAISASMNATPSANISGGSSGSGASGPWYGNNQIVVPRDDASLRYASAREADTYSPIDIPFAAKGGGSEEEGSDFPWLPVLAGAGLLFLLMKKKKKKGKKR